MKMTLDLVITNPPGFAAGRVDYNLGLYENMSPENTPDDWIHVGKIDIDFGVLDLEGARVEALRMIDEKISKARDEFAEQLKRMEDERASLLALPAPSGDES